MDNNKEQHTEEAKEPKLKTWDEAIKELGSFIRKTRAEEVKSETENKESR